MKIEERAKKSIHEYYSCDGEYSCERNGDCIMSGGYNTPFDCCECAAEDYMQGYIKGATEQKQIDDREMSDALFIQRQMFVEKAVHWLETQNLTRGRYDFIEEFKKAMEE
ncbi:MAG: hypothetical protein Q4A15_03580 [Prevotellaceae bacterium]|nr:hypothetical protein [Prevotellaceae bacterium]